MEEDLLRIGQIREWLKTRHVGQAFQPVIVQLEVRSFKIADILVTSFRRRKLPHWELEGSTYFVTFRVHRSLGRVLETPTVTPIVEEALWLGYSDRYLMDAYVVMPDHVHLLLRPLPHGVFPRLSGE